MPTRRDTNSDDSYRLALARQDTSKPGGRIYVGDGVSVPAHVEIKAVRTDGYLVEIDASYQQDSGRYEIHTLSVKNGEAREVTGEGLRSVRVASILRDGVTTALFEDSPRIAATDPSDMAKDGPTEGALEWVATVYRLALVIGDAPTNAVARRLKIPRSTAGRWVTRARDTGQLTVQDPRSSKAREA